MSKIDPKNVNKSYTDPKTGKFTKGNPGGGRPPGQRNYAQIYREALIKLATMNDMDPEEMETDILLKGLASARKGDYRFWKDLHDRLHGQATQTVHQTVEATVNHLNELSDEELLNLTTGSQSGTSS